MSARQTNFVLDVMTVMDHLSRIQSGLTVGQINKAMPYLTRGQIIRVLDSVGEAGLTYHEVMPHGRTGKKVYKMTENAAMQFASIARQYGEHS
jgi:hypothetical protein